MLTTWAWSPVTDLLVVLGTAGYLWLSHIAKSRAGGWLWWRTMCWLLAMLVVVLAVNSAVAVFGDVLFWVHMAQHLMLIMIVPVLLIWARPIELLCTAGGPRAGARVDAIMHARALRWSGWPVAGLAIYTAVVVLAHLTGFQQLSATHGWVRGIELTVFFLSGWLFFLPLVGGERQPWSLPYLLRFVLLAAGMGADTLAGVVLMLTSRVLVPAYPAAHPGWGPTGLGDQELAGAIMWFGGDLLMMILMILVAVQWGRAGGEQQGLGNWLEGARRRALLGGEADAYDDDVELDDDQRALDSYNATLAALHRRQPPQR